MSAVAYLQDTLENYRADRIFRGLPGPNGPDHYQEQIIHE